MCRPRSGNLPCHTVMHCIPVDHFGICRKDASVGCIQFIIILHSGCSKFHLISGLSVIPVLFYRNVLDLIFGDPCIPGCDALRFLLCDAAVSIVAEPAVACCDTPACAVLSAVLLFGAVPPVPCMLWGSCTFRDALPHPVTVDRNATDISPAASILFLFLMFVLLFLHRFDDVVCLCCKFCIFFLTL